MGLGARDYAPAHQPRTAPAVARYHCHILEHEDFDMMRFFQVMPTSAQMAADPALAAEVAEFDAMTRAHRQHRGHRRAPGPSNHSGHDSTVSPLTRHAHVRDRGAPRRFVP